MLFRFPPSSQTQHNNLIQNTDLIQPEEVLLDLSLKELSTKGRKDKAFGILSQGNQVAYLISLQSASNGFLRNVTVRPLMLHVCN